MVHVGGPTEWSGTRQEAVHLRQPRYGLPNSDVEMAFIVGQQFASCRHADPIQEIQCESSHRDQDHPEKEKDQLLDLPRPLPYFFFVRRMCGRHLLSFPQWRGSHTPSADGNEKKKVGRVLPVTHPPRSPPPLTLRSGFP